MTLYSIDGPVAAVGFNEIRRKEKKQENNQKEFYARGNKLHKDANLPIFCLFGFIFLPSLLSFVDYFHRAAANRHTPTKRPSREEEAWKHCVAFTPSFITI